MRDEAILETRGITKRFRGLVAVDRFDIAVRERTIHSLIGPNGAGKTTVFNVITGIYRPEEGKVLFAGRVLNGLKPHEILALGIARTFQNPRLFRNMTCLENVMAGQHAHGRAGFWASLLRLPHQRREERAIRERAEEWLRKLNLWHFRHELARNIPYGCQKLLELARALAAQPKVLLLDEPTCGLNEAEKEAMMGFIEGLPKEGLTVLLVEHNMNVVMGLSDWITVMNYGKKIAEGTPEEVYNNPVVIEAYLGRGKSVLLRVDSVSVAYGAVEALKSVSLSVEGAEIVAVLGANGAGKTTLLKAISGLVPVKSGAIVYDGKRLHELPPHVIARLGVVHIPEGRRVFATLTVEENLNLGGYGCPKEEVARAKERVFALFPVLKERRRQLAGTLSGGEQQMLAIGRGLMRSPKLMLLDEPSLGLAPLLVDQVFSTIVQINKEGVPILIVEQNARKALSIADQAHILEVGRLVLSGPARELAADERVRQAYLGGATYERRRRIRESRAAGEAPDPRG